MANTYKVHFAAAKAAKGIESCGSWFAPKGGLYGSKGPNPAQCKNKANQIDYTTDPSKVTCAKCITTLEGNHS